VAQLDVEIHDHRREHGMRNESDIILPLLHRYAIAIDAQKWELFDEVFTPDVVANYTNSTWVSLRDLET
jgi:hypothetical protein